MSSGYHYGGSGFGQNIGWCFDTKNIEFWGSSKSKLDDVLDSTGEDFADTDLIINCTGLPYTIKPFIKSAPTWLLKENKTEKSLSLPQPHQLVLEWKDFSPPPRHYENLDFWKNIVTRAEEHGIKRIFVCCQGGKGRTGTALSALMMATNMAEDPFQAINRVRENYTEKAVETTSQTKYLINCFYPEGEERTEVYDYLDQLEKQRRAAEKSKTTTKWKRPQSNQAIADDDLYEDVLDDDTEDSVSFKTSYSSYK